ACDHQFFRYRVGPDGRLVNRPPPTPQQQQQQPAQPQPQPQQQPVLASVADLAHHATSHQRLHRPSFPSASAAVPQLPAAAAVASPVSSSYAFSNGPARAPLRVGEYSISSANTASQQPLSAHQQPPLPPSAHHHHHQQLAPSTPKAVLSGQQHPAAAQFGGYYYRDPPSTNPHAMYQLPEYTSRPISHYQQQAPPQLHLPQQHSRGHADAYPWHYANGANSATIHTPAVANNNGLSMAASNVAHAGYEAHSGDMSSQSRSGGKRKAGAPIDSGYFPEPLGSVADGYHVGGGAHNGHSSPVVGGPPNSGGGASRPMPRNYSSGSLFTTAPLTTAGPLASPGGYAAGNMGCNLPPLVSHAATQPVAAVATATGNSVNLPLQHPYHQQRHHLLGNNHLSSTMMAGSGMATRLPVDANATPTLTSASTATPTPGSTSTQLGNGAVSHIVEGNSTMAAAAGTHKLAGRSLPSLALTSGMQARTSLADQMQQQQQQNSGYYYRQNAAPQKPQQPA
ncbi:hypothetical protein GGI00_005389, partial [Coemansia sp. RSA 2681]